MHQNSPFWYPNQKKISGEGAQPPPPVGRGTPPPHTPRRRLRRLGPRALALDVGASTLAPRLQILDLPLPERCLLPYGRQGIGLHDVTMFVSVLLCLTVTNCTEMQLCIMYLLTRFVQQVILLTCSSSRLVANLFNDCSSLLSNQLQLQRVLIDTDSPKSIHLIYITMNKRRNSTLYKDSSDVISILRVHWGWMTAPVRLTSLI